MAYSSRSGGSGKRKPGGSSGRSGSSSRGGSSARGSKSFGRKTSTGRSSSDGDDKPAFKRRDDDKPAFKKKSFGDGPVKRRRDNDDTFSGSRRPSTGEGQHGSREGFKKSSGDKSFGARTPFKRLHDEGDENKGGHSRNSNKRGSYGEGSGSGGFKKKSFDKPFGDRRRRDDGDDKPAFKRRDDGDDRPSSRRSSSDRKKPFGDKPFGDRRKREGDDKPAFKRRDDRGEGSGYKAKRDDDRPFSRSGSSSRSGRSFGGDSKPTWKKSGSRSGGSGRSGDDDRSFRPKKRFDERSGESEWKVFDKKDDASEFVQEHSSKRTHRGQDEGADGQIRLNKYIANTGLCSRREADDMIEAGVIKVNGKIVTELGTKINPGDTVHYGDQLLKREKLVYILLNKPKDYITTTDDPQERKTVLDLVAGACDERVYPVGRLDRNTTGVLLLTNDGDLAERLMHPKYGVEKIYQVSLDMNLRKEDFEKIMEGVELEDGFIKADDMSFVGDGDDKKEVGIVLHSGRNRIVRRLFEHLGYKVNQLDRVGYAGLTKKNLPKGKWRFLETKEVGFLKMKVGGDKPAKKAFSKRK